MPTPPSISDTTVHVVSDGTARGTFVFDEEGNPISGVTAIEVSGSVDSGLLSVKLEVHMPKVDVVALVKSVEFTCPCCNGPVVHHCQGMPLSDRQSNEVQFKS